MKANDFRSKCSELEQECLPVETMNRYVHLIIKELMDPFKKLGNGEWEWKNGTIYQYIKSPVRVVCLSYYRGAMSFFIEYIKPIKLESEDYQYKYYAIWSCKAEVGYGEDEQEELTVESVFEEVCKHVETIVKEGKHPYGRLHIKNNEVEKYITCGTSYSDTSFGCDSVSLDSMSEFLRTLDDLHLIKLYIDELDN